MITRIRKALFLSRRRKEVEAEFELAYLELRRWRPKKLFRQREWIRDADALDLIPRWLQHAITVEDVDKQSTSVKQLVTRCKSHVDNENQAADVIDAASTKADMLRQRSATLHGSAFKLSERRHHAIKDECNHARRARDARAEDAALILIEEKLVAFAAFISRAETVNASLPATEARIAAIKPEEIWLDTGAKETYDDLLATFTEIQKDVKRGDYDKAAQRLREIETLEANLRERGTRRADWALQEVAMWLTSPSLVAAFPELQQFPKAALSTADIENLYALREQIERFIVSRAADQRENNMPTRDLATGRRLAATHPLRMPFEDATDPGELEEFLRCVSAFGHRSGSEQGA